MVASANPQLYVGNMVYDPTANLWYPMRGGTGSAAGQQSVVADTELPAPVAAADNLANPTAPQVLAHVIGWDSLNSQWVRIKSGNSTAAGFLGTTFTHGASHTDGTAESVVGLVDVGGAAIRIAVAGELFNGATWDRPRGPNVFKAISPTALTAGTGATVWTPTSGKKFRLMGWMISTTVAGELIFGDNAVGTVIARSGLLTANLTKEAPAIGNGILSAAANNVLKLDVTVSGTVQGFVFGTEE